MNQPSWGQIATQQSNFDRRVNFSILTPVFNPPRKAFELCIDSVLNQSYPNWHWCLVNDQSTDKWVRSRLDRLARRDKRISVVHRETNGRISAASNDALAMATGEYVALLDHDDELSLNALAVVNHHLCLYPDTDFLYSDEDKIDDEQTHFGTFNKPSWSPERLLCQNYCCHLSVIKTSLVRQVGGFRSEFDGSQDHDLLLRIAETNPKVVHIPEVLYHWRASASSTALSLEAKPYALEAAQGAVTEAAVRRGLGNNVIRTPHGYHRVQRSLEKFPKVSLIVPTNGKKSLVWGIETSLIEHFIRSNERIATYPDFEYIVVVDGEAQSAKYDSIREISSRVNLVDYSKDFNFSEKCNLGAVKAKGEILIFVNDDIEPISPDWIQTLVAFLEDPTVGATGPLLLFDNGLIQSAGHVNPGPGVFARNFSVQASVAGGWPLELNREVSGLTGACLAVRTETFFEVGGFFEELPLNYNDVDFGFKLQMLGYRLVWTPDAALYHFESKSRETRVSDIESSNLDRHWGRFVSAQKTDPFIR